MAKLRKACMFLLFGIIAVPEVIIAALREVARVRYLRWRHPHAHFACGCYADEQSTFEEGVRLCGFTTVFNSKIGMFSYLASYCSAQHCTIGRYCSIGPHVIIGTGVHPIQGMISTYPAFYSCQVHAINYRRDPSVQEYKPITIGHDVWIGARAIILDGVTIGDGAIIGAGSVVTKDVEPYTIVGGTPAGLIRRRFTEEEARTLSEFAWWDRGEAFCRQHAALFADAPSFFAFLAREEAQSAIPHGMTTNNQDAPGNHFTGY